MSKFIVGSPNDIINALHKAGVLKEDPDYVRHVVIDLEVGKPGRIYVELFADSRVTDVLLQGGLQVVERESGAAA